MRALYLALLAASPLACASDEPAAGCTLIGCGEIARLEVITVADGAALANTSIEVCRNGECVRGAVPPPPMPYGDAVYLDGALAVRVDVLPASGGFQLVATVQQLSDVAAAVDGDRYTVAVRRDDGTGVAARAWIATYRESFPNGAACDRCIHADLTPAP